ncbi:MAG TPA: Ig-like domain-containing protein, partial [Candidatus Hydrogenedentes bacterium]|nr:Ig-like domain-containing protein [Candidatus Hydrogenedentota bacterium]HRT22242.1 Ig-like domain-containing protein [Candidatus Hydrogenedentota bacterium]HRT67005.1 Ig-like domain-containing protein [Candidatus Hydrogenedentota bacterium]
IRTYDADPPVVLSVQTTGASPTNAQTVVFRVLFSEPVSGMDASDCVINAVGVSDVAILSCNGGGTTYDVTVDTGNGSGLLRLDILNDGTVLDAAANMLADSFSLGETYEIDKDAPTAVLSSTAPEPVDTSPIPVSLLFSEPVTGFALGDILVANGIAAGLSGNGVAYDFVVYPVGPGVVTVEIPPSVASDAAGNENVAATPLTRTYQSDAPGVFLFSDAPDPVTSSPFAVQAVFSEPVTGFDESDLVMINALPSNFRRLDGAHYSFDVHPLLAGLVQIVIPAGAAENAEHVVNTASAPFERTFVPDGPTLYMTSPSPDPTNVSPIPVTVIFSEDVFGFEATDISATNGTIDHFQTIDGAHYTFDLFPSGPGLVTADISPGVAQNGAGQWNTAAPPLEREYDTERPSVVLSSMADNPTRFSPIHVNIVFSEDVFEFESGDIWTQNGTVAHFEVQSASHYTCDVEPMDEGLVAMAVPMQVCRDAALNFNTASSALNRTYDITSPGVSLASAAPEPTRVSPITVQIHFTEPVYGFDALDVEVQNAVVSHFASTSAQNYSLSLTPIGQGEVSAYIPQAAAVDAAGNPNTASGTLTRTYDTIPPSVLIGPPSVETTAAGPVAYEVLYGGADIITLSEQDVTLVKSGSADGSVTVSGTGVASRTVTVENIVGDGALAISIDAGTASDAAGNLAPEAGPSAQFQVMAQQTLPVAAWPIVLLVMAAGIIVCRRKIADETDP